MSCPSEFALDDAEIHGGDASSTLATHLATCARCQGRVAERSRLASRFAAELARTGWQGVTSAKPRRRKWWPFAIAIPVLAGATALLAVHVRDNSGYRGVKGEMAVEVLARRQGNVFRPDEHAPARTGDELQLTVRAAGAKARYVVAGSVDGTGRFSPFYPASIDGHSLILPFAGQPLAPPIVLDDAPGPERVLVVVSAEPLAVADVRRVAEAQAPGRSKLDQVAGIPVVASWSVIAKQPGGRSP